MGGAANSAEAAAAGRERNLVTARLHNPKAAVSRSHPNHRIPQQWILRSASRA